MKKIILGVAILATFSVDSSFAQDNRSVLRSMSETQNQLRMRINELSIQDRVDVLYHLEQIKSIISNDRPNPYPYPQPVRKLMCDYSNGNLLIDLSRPGAVLHDFGSRADCDYGMQRLEQGRSFCDFSNGNIAYNSHIQQLHDFGSRQECEEGIERIDRGQNFCDYSNGNLLYSPNGQLIYDFGSRAECQNALNRI